MQRLINGFAAAIVLAAGFCVIPAMAQSVQSESLLTTILKRGKIEIGTRDTAMAFSFKDNNGQLVGFDVDLGRLLAQEIFGDASKAEFVVLPGSADRVPAIQSGRVDVVISSLSPWPQRAQVIDFSVPYCLSENVFIVKSDSPIQKNADLAGKIVTSRQGADLEAMLHDAVPNTQFLAFPELSDAFLAMRQGRADAFFYEAAAATYLMRQFPDQYRVVDDKEHLIVPSGIAIGLHQGDQVFVNYINWLLYDLKAKGKLQELHKKWFQSDLLEPNWVKQPL